MLTLTLSTNLDRYSEMIMKFICQKTALYAIRLLYSYKLTDDISCQLIFWAIILEFQVSCWCFWARLRHPMYTVCIFCLTYSVASLLHTAATAIYAVAVY